MGAGDAGGGRRGLWGQVRLVGAASHRPHARVHRNRRLRKLPGQIPSQDIVTCEWQDESTCMSICVSVYLLTQCISNCWRIRAGSARVDWSKAVQASSVQVPKNWELVRSRSKNFLDWTWTRLDGSSPDWSIAGLVESLLVALEQHRNYDTSISRLTPAELINATIPT